MTEACSVTLAGHKPDSTANAKKNFANILLFGPHAWCLTLCYLFCCLLKSVSTMWSDLGAVTGELAGDSGNVVELIRESYEVIRKPTSKRFKFYLFQIKSNIEKFFKITNWLKLKNKTQYCSTAFQ